MQCIYYMGHTGPTALLEPRKWSILIISQVNLYIRWQNYSKLVGPVRLGLGLELVLIFV